MNVTIFEKPNQIPGFLILSLRSNWQSGFFWDWHSCQAYVRQSSQGLLFGKPPLLNKTQHRPKDNAEPQVLARQHIPWLFAEHKVYATEGGGAVAGGAVAEKDPLPIGVLTKATVPR